MKKIIICAALFLFAALLKNAEAQLRINVNVNIGVQPSWGPRGYDYVEYYYLPDIEVYYYVPGHQFIYLSGGNWIFSASLPSRYSGYDLYSGYKVVINEQRAYLYFNQHRTKYAFYRGSRSKPQLFRKNNEPGYFYRDQSQKYKNNPGRGRGRGRN